MIRPVIVEPLMSLPLMSGCGSSEISAMPRFVILRHETPSGSPKLSHWDLMFEDDAVLRTWACETLPEADASVDAYKLPDHRLAYLDYEGPVSGNRGSVTQWEAGEFEVACDSPACWSVELQGRQLVGCLTLTLHDPGTQLWHTRFVPASNQA